MIPRTRTLEVELSTKCTLSCSECPRVTHKSTITQWNAGFLKTKPFLDNIDDKFNDSFIFSGAYGDPIYHPDFADILHTIVNKPLNPRVEIETNGGYISEEKYHKIGQAISSNSKNRVRLTMSIDGSLDNFTQYRINGDRKGTEAGLRILPEYGVHVNWKFISFDYNTNPETLKQIYDTASRYGIERVTLMHSARATPDSYVSVEQFITAVDQLKEYRNNVRTNFKPVIELGVAPVYRESFPEARPITTHPFFMRPIRTVLDKNKQPTDNFIQPNSNTISYDNPYGKSKINEIIDPLTTRRFSPDLPAQDSPKWKNKVLPRCLYKNHQNFIGGDGVYLPCCWLHSNGPESKEYIKTLIGNSFDELSIYQNTFDEIVNSNSWKKLSDNFTNIDICSKKCPSKQNMPTEVSF